MAKGSPRRAVQIYKEAAEQYRLAGDFNAAAAMLAEFEKLAAAAASAPAPAPAASSSGRSVPAAGGASGLPPVPKMWRPTKEDADCESANATERATAGWYITCMEPELPKAPPRYKHPIDSQTLFLKAYDVCGSSSRDTHDCYVDAKVKYLLDNDPIIRSQCQDAGDGPGSSLRNEIAAKLGKTIDQAERKKNAVIACVDSAYIYGPDGPPSVRDQVKARMREQTSTSSDAKDTYQKRLNTSSAPAPHCPPGAGWAPHACCPAGSGMKPTPGAFGAWSCQPLGLALGTAPVQEGTTADVVEAFERRLDQVAEQAVAAADRQLASQMSPEAREECTAASFAAVRSVLKGGVPVVPEKCRGMADIARSQLAYYASTHIDAANSGVEELMAYLPRGQLGPPQAGVQDLKADGRMVREAECMARGGTPEHCVAANEPLTDQAAGQSASGRSAPPPRARFVRGGISP